MADITYTLEEKPVAITTRRYVILNDGGSANDYIEKIIWRMIATDGNYEKRKTIQVYAPHPTQKDRDTFIVWNELKEVPEYFITERDKVFNNTSVRERLAVEIANLYYDEDVTDTLPWE